jgi:hypothetical protein
MPIVCRVRRDQPASYRISLLGLLDGKRTYMLGGVLSSDEKLVEAFGVTTLWIRARDQAGLMGVLNFACDLGLVLLSVEYLAALEAKVD